MKIKKKLPGILGDIILLITAVFCVLPFIYMLLMSLKSTVNAYDFSISLSEITLEQYVKIFTKNHFFRYLLNSMIVAFGGVGLSLLVSCLAGYSFAKLKFRGNDKIFFFLMMTMVVPSEVIIVPLYLIVRGFDWINTFKALILPLPTAFGVFIMRQAIIGVPKELIESAKIDGRYEDFVEGDSASCKVGNDDPCDLYLCRGMEQFPLAFDCDDGGCDAYSAPCHQHDADSL